MVFMKIPEIDDSQLYAPEPKKLVWKCQGQTYHIMGALQIQRYLDTPKRREAEAAKRVD